MTNIVSNRIKEARKARNLTLQQLARKAHIAIDPLTSFEEGKRIPDLEQAGKIKKALDISLCYLIGKTDNHKEIIDIADEFEGFHIHGYNKLTEDEIKEIRLMASDSHLYLDWYQSMTSEETEVIDD